MVEYEIEHLSKQYKELDEKLRSALYTLLELDPLSYHVEPNILLHRGFDICFIVVERWSDHHKMEYVPAAVIDKLYEVNRDAAMNLWNQIKQRRAEDQRISEELHKMMDFTGFEGTKNEQNT